MIKEKLRKIAPYILVIILLVLISYGQTLKMYFWQDDSALIFKLQHQADAAGSFGIGLWERSPYQYLVVPFVPFFKFFKLEPFWYFLVGFLSYFVVIFSFWLFAIELFKNKRFAYISVLLFSAGYVGSDIMFRVINSWQTNIGLFLSLVTLTFYVKYVNKAGIKNYFFSLLFYLLTIEAVYIRSHSLIFTIFAIDLLFLIRSLSIKSVTNFILRQAPFWYLFYKWYLNNQSIGSHGLGSILSELFTGKFEIFTSLFASIGNSFVPDVLQLKFISKFGTNSHLFAFFILLTFGYLFLTLVSKSQKIKFSFVFLLTITYLVNKHFYNLDLHWYRTMDTVLPGLIGLFGLIFSFILSISIWKKQRVFAISILLGYIIVASQIFGYFVQYPESIFGTTHRYLSSPFLGYCLFYGSLCSIWFVGLRRRKILRIVPLMMIILINLYLGFVYQKEIVLNRSLASRNFYKSLLTYAPIVEKGSVFYFDVERNSYYERQFGDFFSVGSMPETTAIAIYYGLDRYDISMFTNFNELVSNISENKTDINKVYTFFYGEGGLKDTTELSRKLLINGGVKHNLNINKLELNSEKVSTLTPQILTITARISEDEVPTFPYSFVKNLLKGLGKEEKKEILKYLVSKSEYYKKVKVTSLSEWRYSEVYNVVDNDINTAWQSHRTRWDKIKDDNITVDMGISKIIDKVYWTNNRNTLTPTNYEIYISLDGFNWRLVKNVVNGSEKKNGQIVKELFNPVPARFVKMRITKTLTEDSPSISEFEVVESGLIVDPEIANQYIDNPFGTVNDIDEWKMIYSYFKPLAKMNVLYTTDKNKADISTSFPIFIDDKIHSYQLVLPQSGTKLTSMKLLLNFPAKIDILNASLINLSIQNMKSRNLIQSFSVN